MCLFIFQYRIPKAATKLPQPHLSTSNKEIKTILKQKQKSAWRRKNNRYDPQKDQINTLDDRTQTKFRLRIGHCGPRKHLKRLGLAYSAYCECGSQEQTPEHILQTCPHLETVRQQRREDTEVSTSSGGKLLNYIGRRAFWKPSACRFSKVITLNSERDY